MNTPTPGPSRLGGSISAATSPVSSSMAGGSGSAPLGGWLIAPAAAVDLGTVMGIKCYGDLLKLSLNTGEIVDLKLNDGISTVAAMRNMLGGVDIGPHVKMLNFSNL